MAFTPRGSEVLADPENVVMVLKDGQVFKNHLNKQRSGVEVLHS
ncbi:MAG: hypothetical protein ABJD70_15395 [Halioglobus sp.]